VDRRWGDQVKFDIFADRDMRHFNVMIEGGDFAIGVHGVHLARAEDIFRRGIRLGDGKGAEEAIACNACMLES